MITSTKITKMVPLHCTKGALSQDLINGKQRNVLPSASSSLTKVMSGFLQGSICDSHFFSFI